MVNPLACIVANANIDLLLSSSWQKKVLKIEKIFKKELEKIRNSKIVKDLRSIGVIELKDDIYALVLQDFCVKNGFWLRPFGKLFYSIVAYTISKKNLLKVTKTMIEAIKYIEKNYEKN